MHELLDLQLKLQLIYHLGSAAMMNVIILVIECYSLMQESQSEFH